jgi:hypothetical protein
MRSPPEKENTPFLKTGSKKILVAQAAILFFREAIAGTGPLWRRWRAGQPHPGFRGEMERKWRKRVKKASKRIIFRSIFKLHIGNELTINTDENVPFLGRNFLVYFLTMVEFNSDHLVKWADGKTTGIKQPELEIFATDLAGSGGLLCFIGRGVSCLHADS